jgi:hypothetical protein
VLADHLALYAQQTFRWGSVLANSLLRSRGKILFDPLECAFPIQDVDRAECHCQNCFTQPLAAVFRARRLRKLDSVGRSLGGSTKAGEGVVVANLDDNLWLTGGNAVRDNLVRGSGRGDLVLAAPAAGGDCFAGNDVGRTVPRALQSTKPCEGPRLPRLTVGPAFTLIGHMASRLEIDDLVALVAAQPEPGPQEPVGEKRARLLEGAECPRRWGPVAHCRAFRRTPRRMVNRTPGRTEAWSRAPCPLCPAFSKADG